MSQLRFNHVFVMLLGIAALAAFVLPRGMGDTVKFSVGIVFYPVSSSARGVAGWVHDRLGRNRIVDDQGSGGQPRPADEIVAENRTLRTAIASLSGRLSELSQLVAERQILGDDILKHCTGFVVTGADPGAHESLILGGSSLGGLHDGMPVLYSTGGARGIAGRTELAGVGGTRVRLLTDPGSRVIVSFGRFRDKAYVPIALKPQLLEGAGRGMMIIRSVEMREIRESGLTEGDWVVLDDSDWPADLKWYNIGRITSISQRGDASLFARISVRPAGDLLGLREVMVMMRN